MQILWLEEREPLHCALFFFSCPFFLSNVGALNAEPMAHQQALALGAMLRYGTVHQSSTS